MKLLRRAALFAAVLSAFSASSGAGEKEVNDMLAEAVALTPYCKKVNPAKAAEFDEILARNKAGWTAETRAFTDTPEFAALVAAKVREMEETKDPDDIAMLKMACARSQPD